MTVYINDLSVIAPGLVERDPALAILRGDREWAFEEMPSLKPKMLPANERRRTTNLIRLALESIQHLVRASDDLERVSTVFVSSDGDLEITDKLCMALAQDDKMVSPTLFHNSVHNAPAGYWSIAAAMQGPSTSISAANASFASGLQEAVAQVAVDGNTVLFVAYDYPAPLLLKRLRHFSHPMAIALRLGSKAEDDAYGRLELVGREVHDDLSYCKNDSLQALQEASPVGAGLPLLEALVRKQGGQIILPYLRGEKFKVTVSLRGQIND